MLRILPHALQRKGGNQEPLRNDLGALDGLTGPPAGGEQAGGHVPVRAGGKNELHCSRVEQVLLEDHDAGFLQHLPARRLCIGLAGLHVAAESNNFAGSETGPLQAKEHLEPNLRAFP
ncbi:hypothetical protein QFZ33_001891 [Arthrobacter globiformis]|nr:hypothetical protein [Arthrobacter globiformis]